MNQNLNVFRIFKKLSVFSFFFLCILFSFMYFVSCKNKVDEKIVEKKSDAPIMDEEIGISSITVCDVKASLKPDGSYEAVVSKEVVSNDIVNNIKVLLKDEKAMSTVDEENSTPLGNNFGDEKQYNIVVKKENESEKTYKLYVLRGKSANFYLKTLTCNKGTLNFKKERFAYKVLLQDAITELTVSETINAIPEDANARVTIDPKGEIKIGKTSSLVLITVLAEDGKTKGEYSVTFAHQGDIKYTELVDVITSEKTVKGSLPTWWDGLPTEEKHPTIKGVFVPGRSVTISPYKLGKYEVSYELWYSVKEWAKQNGYIFKHEGCPGTNTGVVEGVATGVAENDGIAPEDETKYLPVSRISWCDAVVWCNAYSQKEGVDAVYYYEGRIIKNANEKKGEISILAYATVKKGANGYRLPTEVEWEVAARGGDPSLSEWNYRFGASDLADDAAVALPGKASEDYPAKVIIYPFKNRLGLFNMCGNCSEMCWDWYDQFVDENTPPEGPPAPSSLLIMKRTKRGGSVSLSYATGSPSPAYVTEKASIEAEEQISSTLTFRVARSSL